MTEVFIAIGSNLSDPLGQARRAVAALARLPESVLVQASSFYSSRPMGPADQPDYVNAVARLNTRLTPLALLDQLQSIELEQGRVRKDERWGQEPWISICCCLAIRSSGMNASSFPTTA